MVNDPASFEDPASEYWHQIGHREAKIDADGIALARDEHGAITRVAISLSDSLVEEAVIDWLTDYFVLQAHDAHET